MQGRNQHAHTGTCLFHQQHTGLLANYYWIESYINSKQTTAQHSATHSGCPRRAHDINNIDSRCVLLRRRRNSPPLDRSASWRRESWPRGWPSSERPTDPKPEMRGNESTGRVVGQRKAGERWWRRLARAARAPICPPPPNGA
uniref:Uncharacterized protein n=1 Tax=Aegilops tauschii subsp. strangulata TaxID=200361 RepID=A0A453K8P1_AEGTS